MGAVRLLKMPTALLREPRVFVVRWDALGHAGIIFLQLGEQWLVVAISTCLSAATVCSLDSLTKDVFDSFRQACLVHTASHVPIGQEQHIWHVLWCRPQV